MSDKKKPNSTTDTARMEAIGWLAGQFRWESLLADLQELAEREGRDESDAA